MKETMKLTMVQISHLGGVNDFREVVSRTSRKNDGMSERVSECSHMRYLRTKVRTSRYLQKGEKGRRVMEVRTEVRRKRRGSYLYKVCKIVAASNPCEPPQRKLNSRNDSNSVLDIDNRLKNFEVYSGVVSIVVK